MANEAVFSPEPFQVALANGEQPGQRQLSTELAMEENHV